MDYLSQLRDVKSVIATVLSDLFHQSSKMKYTRLGEEGESQENVNALVVDMFEGETINAELVNSHDDLSLCNEDSLEGSIQSVYEKGDHSISNTFDSEICIEGSIDSGHSTESEDMPCKLVITYYFSFDTEEGCAESDCNDMCSMSANEGIYEDKSEGNIFNSEQDNTFEETSFCCDNEEELLEYSSVKNGSKNNLLDGSFCPEVSDGIGNGCLVDYDSDPSSSSTIEQESDSEAIPAVDLDSVLKDDLNISESSTDKGNVSTYCGNPATPSMRKGYIYYSSEVRLYQGELRYDDNCSEKKFKLARKWLKKMFPSQKYVVNA